MLKQLTGVGVVALLLLSMEESIAEPRAVYEGKLREIDAKLYSAIHDGDVKAVNRLLTEGADPNARLDEYIRDKKLRSTPFLHDAVECRKLNKDTCYQIAKVMLSHGAEVGIKDMSNNTPLHIVARDSGARLAELLLTHGADLNAKNSNEYISGYTPVHVATMYNNIAVLKVLLENGADINISPAKGGSGSGLTLLSIAVRGGNVEIAQFLLKQGAPVDSLSRGCRTPLHVALSIPPYWREWTQERTDMIRLLLQYEPATNIEDRSGFTVLERAQATKEAKSYGEQYYLSAMNTPIKILMAYMSTREELPRMKCGS